MRSAPPAEASRPQPPVMFSRWLDFLCVGGLSIAVVAGLFLSGVEQIEFGSIAALAWAQILINMSHFMASYRIVYRDRAMILRHRWASLGIPLLLTGYLLVAILQARSGPPLLVGLLVLVSSCYLAWHYTGQVFGMMASYAFLEGIRFEPGERRLIRTSLRLLLAWHVIWALRIWIGQTNLPEPFWMAPLFTVISAAGGLAFGLGGFGLLKLWRRTVRPPPARVVVAWIAIFFWYLALARWGLPALFLVQLFHAIQYLEFPARVELNRVAVRGPAVALRHMALYAVGLLALSFVVTQFVPGPAMSSMATFVGDGARSVVPVLILTFINIHHYFTDGVAWKLSNPEVRRELFAHVLPASPAGGKPGKAKSVGTR